MHLFAGVPWGAPCAVLYAASQMPNCSQFAGSVRLNEVMARKAEPDSLQNPPLYVSWEIH
jgi:hypothetical protein